MPLSDSRPEPSEGYGFPSGVGPLAQASPPGLPEPALSEAKSSSTDLSPRAVPYHPGEPGDCSHPLLRHRWQASSGPGAWPLSLCLTRPNRVRLHYGSRVRLRQASSGELLHRPLARLPVEWVITGQAPFSLQDQPGFAWHSRHHQNLLKQLSEKIVMFDGDQIPEWCGVGDSFHPASGLMWGPPRGPNRLRRSPRAEHGAGPGNLRSRREKAQAFPNVEECETLLAVALQSNRF